MIYPSGFFTPAKLQRRFHEVLSEERIAPNLLRSAGCNFDLIPATERKSVLKDISHIFTHRFLDAQKDEALLYCPEKDLPLHVDSWLFSASHAATTALPINESEGNKITTALRSRFFFICPDLWTVSKPTTQGKAISSFSIQLLLEKTEGWSICFSDKIVGESYGALMQSIAVQMAREASKLKRVAKRPGRKRKVEPLAEQIILLHPNGIEGLAAKTIARDLNNAGFTDFGDTTLRSAMEKVKNE